MTKVIAKFELLDDEERKTKRNVEQKGQLYKWKEKGIQEQAKETKEEERTNQTNMT